MDSFDDVTSRFEAKKISMVHDKNGYIIKLTIHPDNAPEDLLRDPVGTRYLIAAVRLNAQDEPEASPTRKAGLQAVKIAAMLCADTRFQQWIAMTEGTGEVSEEAAVAYLRKYCRITSRSELKADGEARELFYGLRDQFEQYLRST